MGCGGGVHQIKASFLLRLPMINISFASECVVALTVQFRATKTFTVQVLNSTVGNNHLKSLILKQL